MPVGDLIGMLLTAGIGGGVAFGIAAVHLRRIGKLGPRFAAPRRAAADRLGIRFSETSGWNHRGYDLSGERPDRAVRVAFAIRGKHAWPPWSALPGAGLPGPGDDPFYPGFTTVRVPVRASLPTALSISHETTAGEALRYVGLQDLQLGHPDLDSALRVATGRPAATVDLAQHPAARRGLDAIARTEGMRLDEGWIEIRMRGERAAEVDALLEQASAVARDLETAANSGMLGAAAQLGLDVEARPTGPPLTGAIDGIDVEVAAVAGGARLRATLPDTAPAGLRVDAPGRAPVEGALVRIPNPVLARAIQITADEPAAAAARFTDAVTEAVLSVVRGHDRAHIRDGRVEVRLEGPQDPDALATLVRELAGLARALG